MVRRTSSSCRRFASGLAVLLLLSGCGGDGAAQVDGPPDARAATATSTGAPRSQADPPPACATRPGGPHERFWRLVEASCRRATDGDLQQAKALKSLLRDLTVEEVEEFHRTFVRLNRRLLRPELTDVADEACLPGLGLGEDLGTDFRSWVIAHGQLVFEWVEQEPERLRELPDLQQGCGMGEFFTYAAIQVYEEKTGTSAGSSDLPLL